MPVKSKLKGLDSEGLPVPVKSYMALKDKDGNIIRDKAGNPVLGKRRN